MNHAGYARLTRKRRTWSGFSQAWLASDHLLVVHSTRFTERYQRFALSDIQAIVITEGGRRAIWPGLIALFSLILGLSATSSFGRGFWAGIGVVALALAVLDIARGPRCRCWLQTAVTRERILCISRMSTARSFLAKLSPLIESIQGAVPEEELIDETWPALAPERSPGAATTGSLETLSKPPAITRAPGYAPEVLFGTLGLNSVLVFVGLRSEIGVALGLLPVVYMAEFVLGVVALFQSRARNAAILAVLGAAFLCIVIDPFVMSGSAVWPGLVSGMREAASSGTLPWNVLIAAPRKTMLLASGWRAALAVMGLLVCYFERTTAYS